MHIFRLATTLLALPLAAFASEIRPDDPLLSYVGRFDTTPAEGPRAA